MNTSPELAIRMQRARFNQALADADLAAIGPLLVKDVVLVAGTDSALISGRNAQLTAWKREFESPDRAIYRSSSDSIIVSEIAPIAFEHGDWHGTTAQGVLLTSGRYTAKWRRVGADWLIEAELYLTLS